MLSVLRVRGTTTVSGTATSGGSPTTPGSRAGPAATEAAATTTTTEPATTGTPGTQTMTPDPSETREETTLTMAALKEARNMIKVVMIMEFSSKFVNSHFFAIFLLYCI